MADTSTGAATDAPVEGVAVTVNGTEIAARKGELLIDACERNGVYIPRFCYHHRMRPVGMCRMCLVEVDTGRGPALSPSCMLECTPGMVVDTESDVTRKAQDGVLEFLLINHPLDCPVCDKGGECPLQDQTVAYGPGESRFVEEKRHKPKPIPISDLVLLDRERCILCDRCTRFAKEVAGDPLIHFIHRGGNTEVNTFPDDPFSSYFSGNTVQICPVGALTSTTYRFKARPWDLEEVESTCTTCAVGCRVAVESSRDHVVRLQGVDSDAVNWGWLCDKGRFGFEAIESDDRLREPLMRSADGSRFEPASWSAALGRAAGLLRTAVEGGRADRVAVLGGAPLTNESAYAWAMLAKGVVGTDHVDAQLADGLPAELVLGLPGATIDEALAPGSTVVLLGPDLKEELPALYLRLRHAATYDGVRIVELTPRGTSAAPYAEVSLHPRAGEIGDLCRVLVGQRPIGDAREVERLDAGAVQRAAALLAKGRVTVLLGRASVAESADYVADAARVLATVPGVRFLSTLRRANVRGALEMGLAPGLLPGRVALDAGAAALAGRWPTVPSGRGHDTAGVLAAAAAGAIDVLVLLGADPLGDVADRDLARRALAQVPHVIAVDRFATASATHAEVILPAAGFAEVEGTTTNLEGRVTRVRQKVTAPGTARPDWMIAVDLAWLLGHDLGLDSPEAIRAALAAHAPAWSGYSDAALDAAGTDGLVLPVVAPAPEPADEPTDEAADEAPADQQPDGADGEGADGEASEGEATAPSLAKAAPEPAAPEPPGRALLAALAAAEPPEPPKNDAYAFRLIVSRKLYDDGVLVRQSPHLASLPAGSELAVNPYDFARLGVAARTEVYLTAGDTTLRARLVPDAGVPRGGAAVHLGQPDLDVRALLSVAAPICAVRIDTEEPR